MAESERAIRVCIRKVETGEVRCFADTGWFKDGEFSDFIWDEGNYSCDCNRLLLFVRAAGEPEPDHSDIECSEGKFRVTITDEHGKLLFTDEGAVTPSEAQKDL